MKTVEKSQTFRKGLDSCNTQEKAKTVQKVMKVWWDVK